MPGLSSILDIGKSGLFASQACIEVTGNNIANVDTDGYSRRRVELEEALSIDYQPGQLGTGVDAVSVVRFFDKFVEEQYLDKLADSEHYEALYNGLLSVESLFNEANQPGINSQLSTFFSDWQDLTLDPENYPKRQVLIEDARNLAAMVREADDTLFDLQQQMNQFIEQDIETVNDLAEEIADINSQVAVHLRQGNNPNALYDERDKKVRELAAIMDVKVIDNGGAEFEVMTQAGHTIVDGLETFSFRFASETSITQLSETSSFDGQIYFEGTDDFEYTLEVVSAGAVSNGTDAAQFRLSLDGGQSWVTDEDGNTQLYSAREFGQQVQVGDLKIWFGSSTDETGSPTDPNLSVGDKFTILPKKSVFWVTAAGNEVNVTPQTYMNGQANTTRLTGGSMTGYFDLRDDHIGRYRDRLEGFTEALVWEVNKIHSQGAGLQAFSQATGTYSVDYDDTALGSDSTGLAFGDRLQSGVSSMYFFSAATGELASSSSFGFLDFDAATPGVQGFNPNQHTMSDVSSAINNTFGTFVTATISNHQLMITSDPGYTFGFGTDSAGIYAALGLNTFFEGGGDGVYSLAINDVVVADSDFLNAGHVNGAGEMNPGDNTTALDIAGLQQKEVSVKTLVDGATDQTISQYYDSLVGLVGVDTANAEFNYNYESTLAKELNDRQEEVSGVNLDEEMTNLIKFQHSYRAAAKLITTADEMFQTVLGIKN